jgi:hypothetical protein
MKLSTVIVKVVIYGYRLVTIIVVPRPLIYSIHIKQVKANMLIALPHKSLLDRLMLINKRENSL